MVSHDLLKPAISLYTENMAKRADSKKGDSRARIVETTARLLRVQGYNATGLNQIIEESEAPKGSLYHYFPQGKEELATEAMQLAGDQLLHRMDQLFQLRPDIAMQLLVEEAIKELEDSNFRDGCPIATVSLETSSFSPSLRGVCSQTYSKIHQLVRNWLLHIGAPEERVDDLSLLVFAAYQGAIMLSKVHHSSEPLKRVVPQLKELVQKTVSNPV